MSSDHLRDISISASVDTFTHSHSNIARYTHKQLKTHDSIRPACFQVRGVIEDHISGCWNAIPLVPLKAEYQPGVMRDRCQALKGFLLSAEVFSSSDGGLTELTGLRYNIGAIN